LRFPEFEREWERKKLGELSFKVGKKNKDSVKFPIYSINNKEGFLPQSDQFEGLDSNDRGYDISMYKIIEENTFAYNPARINVGSIGYSNQLKNVLISSLYVCFKTTNLIEDSFLLQFINSKEFNTSVYKNSEGGVRSYLFYENFSLIKISLPSLPEQQKIASFLTTIDTKLTQLKQKKSFLEQYKKGVMQKIFSQEIRFKDENGAEYPKWEKKKLSDIADKIMYGMNAAAIAYDGENKYVRITDIDENSRAFIPNPLTSPDGVIEEKYKLKESDILFTRTGASVGKSYLYNRNDGNLLFAGFLIKFSIINGNPYFIFSQTLLESYNKWIQLMSMRSGQPGINAEEYKSFSIKFPCLAEQTKIANFLSALDEKINHCQLQIEKMVKYKKGLLQKMFC
jgi:type I restriction enzyme S subunit